MSEIQMNTEQAAKYLGFKKGTLNIWRYQGRGPKYIRMGGRIFYFKSDLDWYRNNRRVATKDTFFYDKYKNIPHL
jgi:hypothetical protein